MRKGRGGGGREKERKKVGGGKTAEGYEGGYLCLVSDFYD